MGHLAHPETGSDIRAGSEHNHGGGPTVPRSPATLVSLDDMTVRSLLDLLVATD